MKRKIGALLQLLSLEAAISMSTIPAIQLWLDLSRTAMSLSSPLLTDTLTKADKIIQSIENESQPKRQSIHDLKIIRSDKSGWGGNDRMILLFENEHEYGCVLKVTEEISETPVTAINAISNGKWVVLDCHSVHDKQSRNDLISDLVHLIVPFIMSQSSLPSLLGGTNILTKKGGVAIKCRSCSDVFVFGSMLQASFASAVGSLKATKDGVVWHTGDSDREILMALVIPFDFEIWDAATMINS